MKALLIVLLYVLLLFLVLYFAFIRPGQKKQAKQKEMHDALKVGDKVNTIGGIIGTVTERDGDSVKILIDEKTGTTMTVVVYAVSQVIKPGEGKTE